VGELLPFLIGCAIGIAFAGRSARALRFAPVACILGGAFASAMSGELNDAFWALFVSFDCALVWLGAAVTTALAWSPRRHRPTS
jgi:hypothetical protein